MNGVNNDPFGLMPLWDALLVIYGAFAEICDRHGLRYYMTDGNALGAVRHHGFIPWDDDLDVSMPRQDYEKFLMIASVELPSYLKIVDFKNTPEFGMLFCKIQDSRSDMVQYLEQKVGRNLSNGVFIDVFPIDGFPDSLIGRIWYWVRIKAIYTIRRAITTTFASQTTKGRLAWLLGYFIHLIYPFCRTEEECLLAAEKINKECMFGDTQICGRAATSMWKRYLLPTEVYGDPVFFDFEGIKVPLPHDYDAWLKYDYLNYMQLPPESERHPTHEYVKDTPWKYGPTQSVK